MSSCPCILTSGSRAGKACGRESKFGSFCGLHKKGCSPRRITHGRGGTPKRVRTSGSPKRAGTSGSPKRAGTPSRVGAHGSPSRQQAPGIPKRGGTPRRGGDRGSPKRQQSSGSPKRVRSPIREESKKLNKPRSPNRSSPKMRTPHERIPKKKVPKASDIQNLLSSLYGEEKYDPVTNWSTLPVDEQQRIIQYVKSYRDRDDLSVLRVLKRLGMPSSSAHRAYTRYALCSVF